MKKIILLGLLLIVGKVYAQNYDHVLNYAINSSPVNGIKIKTNMPFVAAKYMPAIHIKGFNYGGSEPIDLTITYYIYSGGTDFYDPANFYFHLPMMSSAGGYTPKVNLANEGGKVVIYINDRTYFQRFTVSVFAIGMEEQASWFEGWSAVDEPLNGTAVVEVPYRNRFKGDVFMSGEGVWNTEGNVGIGTVSPKERLSVNGNIRAHEIKVETSGWPDYVFADDYKISPLKDIATYIKLHKHLPEMPSAKTVAEDGIALGDMNKLLVKKIEELTLHLIDQNERLTKQERENIDLKNAFLKMIEQIKKEKSNDN